MLSFCTRFHAHTFSRFFFVYDTSAYSPHYKETFAFYLILLSKHIGWHLLSIRGRVLARCARPVPNFHFWIGRLLLFAGGAKKNEQTPGTVYSWPLARYSERRGAFI